MLEYFRYFVAPVARTRNYYNTVNDVFFHTANSNTNDFIIC